MKTRSGSNHQLLPEREISSFVTDAQEYDWQSMV